MIQLGYKFADVIRSHNVFVSSGATSTVSLRAPHDVANLARFFGLTIGAAQSAVSSMCHDLVYCSRQRKLGANKCNVLIEMNMADSDLQLTKAEEPATKKRKINDFNK